MAQVYKNVNGKKITKFIAKLDGVQWAVDDKAVDIGHRAERLLMHHRATGAAHIELSKGRVDSYVSLVDSNVTNGESASANSALSIEFGREGFVDENGNEWGAMKGLAILSQAAHVKTKGRKSKAIKVKRRAGRKKPPKGSDL